MPRRDLPDDASVQSLRDRTLGPVLRPGEPGYDDARHVWNARLDRRPELAVRCTGAADVLAAVRFATEHDLLVSVKSGGHGYGGHAVADGGILLDLSPMDAVRVDPAARTVRIQPGARWRSVDHESQAHGLATPGPTASTVGAAGFVLGGGVGYLSRKHGMAVDNLVSADVVTAAGELVHASESENPDLFWALRGGSGNLGVVTSMELRLHEVGPTVVSSQAWHRLEDAGEAVRAFRDHMAGAPDEVMGWAFVLRVPPVDPFPGELRGALALALIGFHPGPEAEGTEALGPLAEVGEPFLAFAQPMPYTVLQTSFDAGMPPGYRWYTKAHGLRDFPDTAVDTFLEHASEMTGPFSMAYVGPGGGAMGRVGTGETAYPHRDEAWALHIIPGWTDPGEDEAHLAEARAFHQAMAHWATGGAYVNLLDGDESDPARAAWGPNLDRMREVKGRWDPENRFRVNVNVEPGT